MQSHRRCIVCWFIWYASRIKGLFTSSDMNLIYGDVTHNTILSDNVIRIDRVLRCWYITLTQARSVSTSSSSTFLSLSASERCLEGVPAAALATLPVGLPRRVSAGDRHQPVTCSALCITTFTLNRCTQLCISTGFLQLHYSALVSVVYREIN